jgi:putative nucleotidyltransferase-like protein
MSLSNAHRAVGSDLRRQRGLASLLSSFSEQNVDVLVIKGAALAYLLYRQPHERPRCDADLLIRRSDLAAAEAVLLRAGYRRQIEPDAELASGQRHFDPPTPGVDSIDLHWRVVNPLVFAELLPFDPAWSRAIPVPPLGGGARTLCLTDALLLACVHRVAHHTVDDDMRWIADVDRLVRRLDPADADAFIGAAAQSRTRQVCAHVLRSASQHLRTPVEPFLERLVPAGSAPEPSAAFIGGPPALARIVASDLRQSRWPQRIQLIGEHLIPSVAYMRHRYPDWPRALMPLAYLVRIGHGAPSWLRRPARSGAGGGNGVTLPPK